MFTWTNTFVLQCASLLAGTIIIAIGAGIAKMVAREGFGENKQWLGIIVSLAVCVLIIAVGFRVVTLRQYVNY